MPQGYGLRHSMRAFNGPPMNVDRPAKPAQSARNERLAKALRANLKRRKQQMRGRTEAEKSPPKPASDNKE